MVIDTETFTSVPVVYKGTQPDPVYGHTMTALGDTMLVYGGCQAGSYRACCDQMLRITMSETEDGIEALFERVDVPQDDTSIGNVGYHHACLGEPGKVGSMTVVLLTRARSSSLAASTVVCPSIGFGHTI